MAIMNYIKILLIVMIFSLTGCLESSFQLADESRLPKWFVVAAEGVGRDAFTVQMDLHSTFSGGKNVFKLYKKDKFFNVKRYIATSSEQPGVMSVKLSSKREGFPKGYPRYMVITFNNIVDIVELRKMEPFFYMTDDPEVWRELVQDKAK